MTNASAAASQPRPSQDAGTEWVAFKALDRELRLEYQWINWDGVPDRHHSPGGATIGATPAVRPLLVFLHEGLGSLSMWRDWPARACAAANCRGLVFSRYGYGKSTPRPSAEKWPVTFMHRQAQEVLPAFFTALGIDPRRDRPVLFGHSDGGSIALLYAAMYPDAVAGIAVAAPHIFVEDVTIRNIELARDAYAETDLRDKLGRHHADPDSAFRGWNDVWLDPAFRLWDIQEYLPRIACPVLAMQGEDDEYGTLAQIQGIQRLAPQTRLVVLPACRHSPHRDQPDAVIRAVADFVDTLENPG